MAVAASPAAFPTTEGRIRALVEAELAAELARRDRTRLHVEDQQWIYELVGRVVGVEQRQASAPVTVDESELLWRRVFAAVSPLARPMSVTIRRHPSERFRDLGALAASGFVPHALIPFLEAAVAGRLNIL